MVLRLICQTDTQKQYLRQASRYQFGICSLHVPMLTVLGKESHSIYLTLYFRSQKCHSNIPRCTDKINALNLLSYAVQKRACSAT